MPEERRFIESTRLDRIENKLDQLAEYINSVTRIDEKVISLETRCKDMDKRVTDVEKSSNDNSIIIKGFQRAFWIIFGAIVVSAVAYFGGG